MMSGLGLALWMMHLSSTSSSSFTTSSDPALWPTSSALVGGTGISTVRQKVGPNVLRLTENIELCTGSNWLISSVGSHLALVHGLISEAGVSYLEVEHSALVCPEHCVPSEAGELSVVSCNER